jgi:hypothetical protein
MFIATERNNGPKLHRSGMFAALPPHTAERLSLSGDVLLKSFPEAVPQEKIWGRTGSGKAEPYRKVRRQAAGRKRLQKRVFLPGCVCNSRMTRY